MKETDNPFKLARTTYNQHGKQSVADVSQETGITKSCIDDLESNIGKPRGTSYLTIKKLAQHYGVSSDYLLGLSPVPPSDPDLAAACIYLGLSKQAVENLLFLKQKAQDGLLSNEVINSFFASTALNRTLYSLCYLFDACQKTTREIEAERRYIDTLIQRGDLADAFNEAELWLDPSDEAFKDRGISWDGVNIEPAWDDARGTYEKARLYNFETAELFKEVIKEVCNYSGVSKMMGDAFEYIHHIADMYDDLTASETEEQNSQGK